MRCSVTAAAAELERQQGRERRKTIGRGRMRKDLVVLIYKGGLKVGAKNEEAENLITQRLRRLDFRDGY